MRGLTTKQHQMLVAIALALAESGLAPTVRELGRVLGVTSSCTVQRHLEALEKKGFIERSRYGHRSLQLTEAGRAAVAGEVAQCAICELPVSGLPTRDLCGRLWCAECAARTLARVKLEQARTARAAA